MEKERGKERKQVYGLVYCQNDYESNSWIDLPQKHGGWTLNKLCWKHGNVAQCVTLEATGNKTILMDEWY